jgi:hypothetical protein
MVQKKYKGRKGKNSKFISVIITKFYIINMIKSNVRRLPLEQY